MEVKLMMMMTTMKDDDDDDGVHLSTFSSPNDSFFVLLSCWLKETAILFVIFYMPFAIMLNCLFL